jgi:hypothetical protein
MAPAIPTSLLKSEAKALYAMEPFFHWQHPLFRISKRSFILAIQERSHIQARQFWDVGAGGVQTQDHSQGTHLSA